jgi:hypothetical protein
MRKLLAFQMFDWGSKELIRDYDNTYLIKIRGNDGIVFTNFYNSLGDAWIYGRLRVNI